MPDPPWSPVKLVDMVDTTSDATTRPRVIVDCDPGHDDAVALVVAAHVADVRGIVTVGGNADLDRTTYNALVMRDLIGLDAPVHRGCGHPLVATPHHAASVHGESGLDGADLPAPVTALDGTDGVGFIIDTCRSEAGLWLIPTGPLTNIAMALRQAPDIAEQIAGVSLMGGGSFGNRSAVAEFNIWADPHAAAIVFSTFDPAHVGAAPGSLTMAGLDVTHRFQLTPERIEATRVMPGRLAQVLAGLFDFFSATYLARHDVGSMSGAALHDPLAVLAVSHPELFERRRRHVVVETKGEHTAGMTVIDERTLLERSAPNCDVLVDVDADAAFAIVLDAIRAV
jgi:inosine-uridine nucleoside N-ribohydrolase